ncbi:MAG TPA: SDR family oxidoreductase [Solirubrobacterales bacterium]
MEVVVAGGHGKIAMLLHPLLAERGDSVRALIRNPDHAGDVRAAGAEPVVFDLEAEGDATPATRGADAIVFAAGAGPGSGVERKWTVDYGAAAKLIDAARRTGTDRYVIVSSIGADDPPAEGGDVFGEYLRAKGKADSELAAAGLAHTIVRPGMLTDDQPTGRVKAAPKVGRAEIPRADVAAVLAACLHLPETVGKAFTLVSGETPIEEALRALD